MAAAYAFHIAQNQPFVDGNKRTALNAALRRDSSFMVDIAGRKLTKEGLADLFKKLSHHP